MMEDSALYLTTMGQVSSLPSAQHGINHEQGLSHKGKHGPMGEDGDHGLVRVP